MTEQNPLMEEAAKTVADVREAATVLFQKLQELTEEHGEQAVELALAVARIDAMSQLVFPIFMLFGTTLLWWFWTAYPRTYYNKMRACVDARREKTGETRAQEYEDHVALAFWVSTFAISIFTLVSFLKMANQFWAIVGSFAPELLLAKKAMDQVL